MPLFDFVCRHCGDKFEILVAGGRKPACPKCNGEDLEKQLSVFAFRSSGGSGGAGNSAGSKCSGCAGGSCATCH